MKRREKLEKEEVSVTNSQILTLTSRICFFTQAERQARIAEEAANMGPSNRLIEEEGLHKLLSPIGLRMKDIKVKGVAGNGKVGEGE